MKFKRIIETPATYVLVFSSGDEVQSQLLHFAKTERIAAASFTAIGAFEECMLGYFDWQTKDYRKIPIEVQCEVLSLVGNIAESDGGLKMHAHAVVGFSDASTSGGHLLSAKVRPTLEVTLIEAASSMVRKIDAETGLPLIKL